MMQVVEMREALRQAMDEEMARDERVFLLGEEVGSYNGAYKVSKGLLGKWGAKRVIDTPICESSFTGLAIGAAMMGLKPIVEYMSWNFSFVAADQLISNACKIHYMSGGRFSVPVVFRGPNGAAAQVSAQHSHNVESIYGNLPGWSIISPSNAYDAKGLLKTAIRSENPVLFLENELLYGDKMEIPVEEYLIPFGKAVVKKAGKDLTIISYSRMLKICMEAVKELTKMGIDVELIDLRSIKPLDFATIEESMRKTHRCLIVEEGHSFTGISSEIGFSLQERCFDFLDGPIERVCSMETPLSYSVPMEKETLPTVERILDEVKNLF